MALLLNSTEGKSPEDGVGQADYKGHGRKQRFGVSYFNAGKVEKAIERLPQRRHSQRQQSEPPSAGVHHPPNYRAAETYVGRAFPRPQQAFRRRRLKIGLRFSGTQRLANGSWAADGGASTLSRNRRRARRSKSAGGLAGRHRRRALGSQTVGVGGSSRPRARLLAPGSRIFPDQMGLTERDFPPRSRLEDGLWWPVAENPLAGAGKSPDRGDVMYEGGASLVRPRVGPAALSGARAGGAAPSASSEQPAVNRVPVGSGPCSVHDITPVALAEIFLCGPTA